MRKILLSVLSLLIISSSLFAFGQGFKEGEREDRAKFFALNSTDYYSELEHKPYISIIDDKEEKIAEIKSTENTAAKKTVKQKQESKPVNKKEVKKEKPQEQNIVQTNQENEGETMYVTATAYTAYCEGCSGITYTGVNLRDNPNQKVIAVDPNVIPLGSKVWVEGYGTAIAADIGGAIKGNRIDVFIPNEEEAKRFGIQQLRIKILN